MHPARTSTIIYMYIYIFFIYIYLYIYIYICNIFNDLLVHPISHSINTYLSIAQTQKTRKRVHKLP